jgi:hypothetical protein
MFLRRHKRMRDGKEQINDSQQPVWRRILEVFDEGATFHAVESVCGRSSWVLELLVVNRLVEPGSHHNKSIHLLSPFVDVIWQYRKLTGH